MIIDASFVCTLLGLRNSMISDGKLGIPRLGLPESHRHSSYPPPNLTSFPTILYIVCYLKTFISYYMFYSLHVVEPLRYDSVLIKETNE